MYMQKKENFMGELKSLGLVHLAVARFAFANCKRNHLGLCTCIHLNWELNMMTQVFEHLILPKC